MSFDVNWDLEKYKEEHESDEHWLLRRNFMERWKPSYPEERLVCLARVFANIEFMGCRYPTEVMQEVATMSKEVNVKITYHNFCEKTGNNEWAVYNANENNVSNQPENSAFSYTQPENTYFAYNQPENTYIPDGQPGNFSMTDGEEHQNFGNCSRFVTYNVMPGTSEMPYQMNKPSGQNHARTLQSFLRNQIIPGPSKETTQNMGSGHANMQQLLWLNPNQTVTPYPNCPNGLQPEPDVAMGWVGPNRHALRYNNKTDPNSFDRSNVSTEPEYYGNNRHFSNKARIDNTAISKNSHQASNVGGSMVPRNLDEDMRDFSNMPRGDNRTFTNQQHTANKGATGGNKDKHMRDFSNMPINQPNPYKWYASQSNCPKNNQAPAITKPQYTTIRTVGDNPKIILYPKETTYYVKVLSNQRIRKVLKRITYHQSFKKIYVFTEGRKGGICRKPLGRSRKVWLKWWRDQGMTREEALLLCMRPFDEIYREMQEGKCRPIPEEVLLKQVNKIHPIGPHHDDSQDSDDGDSSKDAIECEDSDDVQIIEDSEESKIPEQQSRSGMPKTDDLRSQIMAHAKLLINSRFPSDKQKSQPTSANTSSNRMNATCLSINPTANILATTLSTNPVEPEQPSESKKSKKKNKCCVPLLTGGQMKRFKYWIHNGKSRDEALAMSQKPLRSLPEYKEIKDREKEEKRLYNEQRRQEQGYDPTVNSMKLKSKFNVFIQDASITIYLPQSQMLWKAIQDCIDDEDVQVLGSGRKSGCAVITCADEYSRDWLDKQVPSLMPWPGANLKLVNESDVTMVLARAFFAGTTIESDVDFIDRLNAQNSDLGCHKWKVLSKVTQGDGQLVIFRFSETVKTRLEVKYNKLKWNNVMVRIKVKNKNAPGPDATKAVPNRRKPTNLSSMKGSSQKPQVKFTGPHPYKNASFGNEIALKPKPGSKNPSGNLAGPSDIRIPELNYRNFDLTHDHYLEQRSAFRSDMEKPHPSNLIITRTIQLEEHDFVPNLDSTMGRSQSDTFKPSDDSHLLGDNAYRPLNDRPFENEEWRKWETDHTSTEREDHGWATESTQERDTYGQPIYASEDRQDRGDQLEPEYSPERQDYPQEMDDRWRTDSHRETDCSRERRASDSPRNIDRRWSPGFVEEVCSPGWNRGYSPRRDHGSPRFEDVGSRTDNTRRERDYTRSTDYKDRDSRRNIDFKRDREGHRARDSFRERTRRDRSSNRIQEGTKRKDFQRHSDVRDRYLRNPDSRDAESYYLTRGYKGRGRGKGKGRGPYKIH